LNRSSHGTSTYDWNQKSHRPYIEYLINVCVSVVKPAFSYTIVLITGLGCGVTRSDLDCRTLWKIHTLVFLYCTVHLLWEFLSFYWHPYDISKNVLALMHVAGLLVNLFLFLWMLEALRKTAESLEGERRALFKRVRTMIILGLCVSLPATAVQLLDLSGLLTEDLLPNRTAWKWHYQWFVFDGTCQIIFGAVFIGVLCQWAPHNDTSKYLYDSANRNEDPVEDASPTFAIEDDADDLEVEVRGRSDDGKVRPEPDRIGVAAAAIDLC